MDKSALMVQSVKGIIPALLANKVLVSKTAIILCVVSLFYYQDLALIFSNALEFTTGNISNYVITIPFLAGCIIYRKRNILKTVAKVSDKRETRIRIDDALGVTLCVIAISIYIAGSATLYALEYHMLSLPILLAGSTMFLFNIATLRHVIVAILLTLYIQPPPGEIVSELAADLSWTSAVIVENMLHSLGVPIALDSSLGAPALVIGSEGAKTPFFVGEPSSGVFSTIGLSLFAIFVAYIIRGKAWKRGLLFLTGFPLFYLLNTLRIAIVISLWYLWGQQVSEAYHVISGSSMVAIGTLAILLMGEKIFKLNIRSPKSKKEECGFCSKCRATFEPLCLFCGRSVGHISQSFSMLTLERIAIFVFIAFVAISVTTASTTANESSSRKLSDLDIKKIKGPETIEYFFPKVSGWDQKYAYRDSRIESILNQDAALAYRYIPLSNGTGAQTSLPSIYATVQISTGHHVWEDSLVTYPSRVGRPGATVLLSEDIDITGDVKGRFLLFKRVDSESIEAVLYWFERTPLKLGSNFENRNVLISIWAITDSMVKSGMIQEPNDAAGIKHVYLSLAIPTAKYWDEQSAQLSSSELLYSFFSKNINLLLVLVVAPLALFIIHDLMKRSASSTKKYKLYQQLVSEDQIFVGTLLHTPSNRRQRTGESVSLTYQLAMGKRSKADQITQMLKKARNSGLIMSEVASIRDEPLLVWRPTFTVKRHIDVSSYVNRAKEELAKLNKRLVPKLVQWIRPKEELANLKERLVQWISFLKHKIKNDLF